MKKEKMKTIGVVNASPAEFVIHQRLGRILNLGRDISFFNLPWIEVILPYPEKDGVTVESINPGIKSNPQIVGKRWEKLAFIAVRTACYPSKGQLTPDEFLQILRFADNHGATAFFASVGVACATFPDKSPVTTDAEMQLPIRDAGFYVSYPGLVIMTTSDRVQVWPRQE